MTKSNRPRVVIVDYGMGNLFSVKHACEHVGLNAIISNSAQEVLASDAVILPGVGAFGDAMNALRQLGLVDALRQVSSSSKPLVGICLGAQLFLTESFEFGHHIGLEIIPGQVISLRSIIASSGNDKVPHLGWNGVWQNRHDEANSWECALLARLPNGVPMYFVHSYVIKPHESSMVFAVTRYAHIEFCSAFRYRNVFGFQFHPERSGPEGLKIYENLASQLRQAEGN